MFQVFKTFFRKTDIRGNGEKKNGNNPVHFHQTLNLKLKTQLKPSTSRLCANCRSDATTLSITTFSILTLYTECCCGE